MNQVAAGDGSVVYSEIWISHDAGGEPAGGGFGRDGLRQFHVDVEFVVVPEEIGKKWGRPTDS